MRFQFIHAADLHIDSPLQALGAKDPAVAQVFAAAGRKAVERLIAETIDSGARFLVIAGDVFDRDWRDVATGYFFARELGKLDRAGVKTFLIKGNHDAESVMSRALNYPASVHLFDTRKGQTAPIEDLRVAVHGRSFPERGAPDDFVAGYAPRREGWLNVGVLHTGLDGRPGHDPYAPCTIADLTRFGYDYWALGHIHAREIVHRDPWIVYSGNVQGRSPRETGERGAMRVTVEDGRIVAVEPFPLDAARWAHVRVDAAGLEDEEALLGRIADALGAAHAEADGRTLAVRVTLTGETPAHARWVARAEPLLDEARALGLRLADDVWVEKLRFETRAPLSRQPIEAGEDSFDVETLLDAAAAEPGYAAAVAALAAEVASKLPRDLRDVFLETAAAEAIARSRDWLAGARTGAQAGVQASVKAGVKE